MAASRPEKRAPVLTWPTWQTALLLGAAYFACAEAGKFLSVRDSAYISFWLPAGVYVAVLLLNGRRTWPWLVLAAFAANLAFDLLHGTKLAAALLFCITNAVQSVLGAWLVRRFVAERPTLATLGEFVGFLGLAGALSTAVGAAIGAATLVAFGYSTSFAQSWEVWWGSNAMAILLVSPFILTWFAEPRPDYQRLAQPGRLIEAALLVFALLVLTWHLLFVEQGVMSPNKGWLVLALLWAGLRFGPFGAAAATLLVSMLFAFFTTQFFAGLTPDQVASGEYVFVMQTSLAVAALLAWIPAIVVGERDNKVQALGDSESRLRLAIHASNIGLWDWDIAGDRLYYSPEWKSQLGYREDEIENRYGEWRDRLHPDDRESMLPKVNAYLANPRGSYEAEYRLRHKDGSYRWIYARAQVEADAEGRPYRMIGCHIDVTERKRSEEDLQQSVIRLQELSRRLTEVEEAERRNINRELHDRVGQTLSVANLSLNLIQKQLPADSAAEVSGRLADVQRLIESSARHVRDVMADLRPPALDDYGLLAALRTYAEPFAARLGVPVTVDGEEPDPRLPLATETALFRIAQEALTNVAKHARAGKVEVRLAARNGRVELSVSDDGIGIAADPAAPARPTWGVKTMRERAEAVGAKIRFTAAPGRGTRVVIAVERDRA